MSEKELHTCIHKYGYEFFQNYIFGGTSALLYYFNYDFIKKKFAYDEITKLVIYYKEYNFEIRCVKDFNEKVCDALNTKNTNFFDKIIQIKREEKDVPYIYFNNNISICKYIEMLSKPTEYEKYIKLDPFLQKLAELKNNNLFITSAKDVEDVIEKDKLQKNNNRLQEINEIYNNAYINGLIPGTLPNVNREYIVVYDNNNDKNKINKPNTLAEQEKSNNFLYTTTAKTDKENGKNLLKYTNISYAAINDCLREEQVKEQVNVKCTELIKKDIKYDKDSYNKILNIGGVTALLYFLNYDYIEQNFEFDKIITPVIYNTKIKKLPEKKKAIIEINYTKNEIPSIYISRKDICNYIYILNDDSLIEKCKEDIFVQKLKQLKIDGLLIKTEDDINKVIENKKLELINEIYNSSYINNIKTCKHKLMPIIFYMIKQRKLIIKIIT